MAARAATTLLLLTRHSLVCADFARDNSLLSLAQEQRPDVNDWPILVEAALALGGKPGRNVFVLCSDLWTQHLSLGKAAAGLQGVELASALNFEAEALSGHSAVESTVGVQALPAGEGHWIVQVRLADLDYADEIIRTAGGRFAGVAHPGGVPTALGPHEGRWGRVELWPDAVVLVRGELNGPIGISVLNTDPSLGRWKTEWDQWRQGLGDKRSEQTLIAPGIPTPSGAIAPLSLEDDVHLKAWLRAWAVQLTDKKPRMPLVRPEKKPLTPGQRWGMTLAFTAAAFLLVATPYFLLQQSVETARAELKGLQGKRAAQKKRDEDEKARQKKLLKDEEARLVVEEKKLKGLRTKELPETLAKKIELAGRVDRFERAVKAADQQRRRLPHLLTKLGDHGIEDLYVKTIDNLAGEPTIHGVCLKPEAADHFAESLARHLHPEGWEIQSLRKQATKKASDDGPWQFDITLRSAGSMKLELENSKGKAQR